MSYSDQEQLRQRLMELHYDLLDESEARLLREAIQNDPRVAAQWEKTRRLAQQISDATRLHTVDVPDVLSSTWKSGLLETADDPEVSDRRSTLAGLEGIIESAKGTDRGSIEARGRELPSEATSGQAARIDSRLSGKSAFVSRSRSLLTSGSIAAIAASLGMLLIGSWYLERLPEQPTAAIRLEASQVPDHVAKSDHEFRIVTSRVEASSAMGRFPVTPALLSFSVLARETTLFSGTARTDDDGSATIALPDALIVPHDAKLRVTADSVTDPAESSSLELPLEPTRCVTYLTLDRPIYRPGETIYFRSLTLLRRSMKVGAEFPIRYELVGPDGAMVPDKFIEGVTRLGVGNGSVVIPPNAPAGSYTLVARSLDGFFPEERRVFEVRAYRVPTFKKELQFDRRSYGPGDSVQAEFSATRVDGAPVGNVVVAAEAEVDGKVIDRTTTRLSNDGTCSLSFRMPSMIAEGTGELRVSLQDNDSEETLAVVVPIHGRTLSLHFYPEGGYLVNGLDNRVYFRTQDSRGVPVAVEGKLLDGAGEVVAELITLRDGLGSFSFRPDNGQQYRLEMTQPDDVDIVAELPQIVEGLPVMDTGSGVFAADQPIQMLLRSERPRSVLIRAVSRGRQVAENITSLQTGDNPIELAVDPDTSGVVRVTVLDSEVTPPRPLVERLVYRRPPRRLQVEVEGGVGPVRGSPPESVRLTIQTRDENGNPVASVLGVSVVDQAALSLDERDLPSMTTKFLLLSEVEDPEQLEDADFYLSESPDAARSLDLLLGTQGWRRFVEPLPDSAPVEFREQLIRLLELDGNVPAEPASFDNASRFTLQWQIYRDGVNEASRQLRIDLRWLAAAVGLLWLVVYAWLRRRVSSGLAICLLIASTSLVINGCGASYEAVDASMEPADSAIAIDGAPPLPNVMPRTDSAAPDSVMFQNQTPPRLVDWLDPEKAAWLLRIARDNGVELSQQQQDDRVVIAAQELRRFMEARGIDAAALADELISELQFPVRQYSHVRVAGPSDAGSDFAETLYWHPMLVTDESGRATIEFDLSDSQTTFQLYIDGHTDDGRIGSGNVEILSAGN